MSFHIFNVEYIIDYDLRVVAPLAIRSAGSPYGAIDNPIVKIRYGEKELPYIPGSSLKGVFRSEAERYVRTIYGDTPEYVCNILDPRGEKGELHRKEKEEGSYRPCLVCRVFGGPTIASSVIFHNAFPKDDHYSISVMTRVSINRIVNAQHPGRLFDVEFINPGTVFTGAITIENIDILSNESKEAKLFNVVFNRFKGGFMSVGSGRSVGYGLLSVDRFNVKRITLVDGRFIESDVTNEYMKVIENV